MRRTHAMSIVAMLAACGSAAAQGPWLIDFQENSEGGSEGGRATAPDVAVGEPGVVVAANRRMGFYSKAGSTLDFRDINAFGYPFWPRDPTYGILLDPRAHHDPIRNRFWVHYSEANHPDARGQFYPCSHNTYIHIAVNKDPAFFPLGGTLDTFDDDYWWYYTGSSLSPGNGGVPLDLQSTAMKRYKESPEHDPYSSVARLPTMAFDERAVILTPNSYTISCDSADFDGHFPVVSQQLVIIPLEHGPGGSLSILDGDRPSESDLTLVRLDPGLMQSQSLRDDNSEAAFAVQEPFEQAENATFYISALDRLSFDLKSGIRLKGLFYDDTQDPGKEWTLQQRINPFVPQDLLDMPLLDPSLHFYSTIDLATVKPIRPLTPDAFWGPLVQGYFFHSAVLVPINNNEMRIFATHTIQPADEEGDPSGRLAVQWYVIDPRLDTFHDTPAPSATWQPRIVAAGRLDVEGGDTYHPTIAVTRQGLVFLQYTYSDATTRPQIRQVRIDSSYTGVVPNSDILLQPGPAQLSYEEGTPPLTLNNWALYADMQADPFECEFWSVHTLVHDNPPPFLPTDIPERAMWLFNTSGLCNNANLNEDLQVDLYDMAMFNDLFAAGARRVDMNIDGETDATDAALYNAAYDAATGP